MNCRATTTIKGDVHLDFAVESDVEEIVSLVNQAYRGEPKNKSWTTEHDLVEGERATPEEVRELVMRSDSLILLSRRAGQIVAAVHLEKISDSEAYLGMLAVAPTRQREGLGKMMLRAAENYLRDAWQCTEVSITVISQRTELIDFYRRRGYVPLANIKPYPGDGKFGKPKLPSLTIEAFSKSLVKSPAESVLRSATKQYIS